MRVAFLLGNLQMLALLLKAEYFFYPWYNRRKWRIENV